MDSILLRPISMENVVVAEVCGSGGCSKDGDVCYVFDFILLILACASILFFFYLVTYLGLSENNQIEVLFADWIHGVHCQPRASLGVPHPLRHRL